MTENTKFTILLDMLNRKIADLNIKIAKDDPNKENLEKQLNDMLPDFEDSKVNVCANNIYKMYKEYGKSSSWALKVSNFMDAIKRIK